MNLLLRKTFLIILNASGILISTSESAVLITFDEVGNDVVATTSGTFIVPPIVDRTFTEFQTTSGSATGFAWFDGTFNRYGGGSATETTLLFAADTASGSVFGYGGSQFFFAPESQPQGSVYTPITTWTWNSTNIDALFAGGLNTTALIVFEASNGETISFVNAVPEPSSLHLATFFLIVAGAYYRKR